MVSQKSDLLKRACRGTKPDGARCSLNAQEGGKWCFFHDPDKAAERRAAQVRGGQGNQMPTLPINVPDFAPETVSDLRPLLAATINQVRRREINPNAATAICNLVNSLMRTFEDGDLRRRLSDIEQRLLEQKKMQGSYDPDAERRS
jgi:hypothetical protein